MSFTGDEGEQITLEEAAAMTKNYRDSAGTNPIISHYIGKSRFDEILEQEGCVGIRIYYGIDENGQKELVLVGVDEDENDLYRGVIVDKAINCPSNCSSANPLNEDTV